MAFCPSRKARERVSFSKLAKNAHEEDEHAPNETVPVKTVPVQLPDSTNTLELYGARLPLLLIRYSKGLPAGAVDGGPNGFAVSDGAAAPKSAVAAEREASETRVVGAAPKGLDEPPGGSSNGDEAVTGGDGFGLTSKAPAKMESRRSVPPEDGVEFVRVGGGSASLNQSIFVEKAVVSTLRTSSASIRTERSRFERRSGWSKRVALWYASFTSRSSAPSAGTHGRGASSLSSAAARVNV